MHTHVMSIFFSLRSCHSYKATVPRSIVALWIKVNRIHDLIALRIKVNLIQNSI